MLVYSDGSRKVKNTDRSTSRPIVSSRTWTRTLKAPSPDQEIQDDGLLRHPAVTRIRRGHRGTLLGVSAQETQEPAFLPVSDLVGYREARLIIGSVGQIIHLEVETDGRLRRDKAIPGNKLSTAT